MKTLLLALAVLFVVVESRRFHRHRRSTRDVVQELNTASNDFPRAEWEDFLTKLRDAFEGAPNEVERHFGREDGWTEEGVNNTLNELKDTLGDKFEAVRAAWVKAEAKMNRVTDRLKKITMQDVIETAKREIQGYIGDINSEDGQQTLDSLEARWTEFWNKITGSN